MNPSLMVFGIHFSGLGEYQDGMPLPNGSVILQDGRSLVTYHPGYLNRRHSDELLTWMLDCAPWENDRPMVFGKIREVKRQTCAFGDKGVTYTYSGMQKSCNDWPQLLDHVLTSLMHDTSTWFNFALANHYPDGSAGIGKHADDEKDIVKGSPIVGLSLGHTRDFILYQDGKKVASVPLQHGSLIVMWGETQQHYKHAVPVRAGVKAPRVSITFREIVQ